jgi:hypothetical protein
VVAFTPPALKSVFLISGIFFRNPMIPAALVTIWENLSPFLSAVLKKISVIFT